MSRTGKKNEYFKYYEEYAKKYDNVAILMQKGAFYEIYEEPNNDNQEEYDFLADEKPSKTCGNAVYLSKVLNMILTAENKRKPISADNCHMIGFNIISYEKNKECLLRNGFTVVTLDEIKEKKNNKYVVVGHKIREIVTPTTFVNDNNYINIMNKNNNNITCLYIEYIKSKTIKGKYSDYIFSIGVANIDLETGKNVIFDSYSKDIDPMYPYNELSNFLYSYKPKEIIVYIEDLNDENYIKFLEDNLELNKYGKYTININKVNPEYKKIEYQNGFLKKLTSVENAIDFFDLEKNPYGTISYICICQYCYEIDKEICKTLCPPDTKWIDSENHCVAFNNTLKQLDIFPTGSDAYSNLVNKKIDSLLSIVDNTSTLSGKRLLKNMLANPLTDVETLEFYYNIIDEFMNSYDSLRQTGLIVECEKLLKTMPDFERYHRKILMKKINPSELHKLYKGYLSFIDLIQLCLHSDCDNIKKLYNTIFNEEITIFFNKHIEFIMNKLNIDLYNNLHIKNNMIYTNETIFKNNSKCEKYTNDIKKTSELMNDICSNINSVLDFKGKDVIYFDLEKDKKKTNDDDDDDDDDPLLGKYVIKTTPTRANKIKSNIEMIDKELCGHLEFKTIKDKTVIITSNTITSLTNEYERYKYDYAKYCYNNYFECIKQLSNISDIIKYIVSFISILDYLKSNAKTAIKNNYHRPIIDNTANIPSYLDVTDLRHPIIEKIITDVYIPNNIILGKDKNGLIIYGLNSSGKSSFTKSVGIAIIMAQAGMYVAGKCIYKPYSKIMTRLTGEDDIYRSRSSYIVEMIELRSILRNMDENTLILGDELCRGTEIFSASSISITAFESMIESKSSLIFSTHLHNLMNIDEFTQLDKLYIKHFSAVYDIKTNNLTFGRIFKDGSGDSNYGIEVAKWVGLDDKFIKRADSIRKKILNDPLELFNSKKSKYNYKVYLDTCSFCNSKSHLETHHINEQALADENNFIDHYHKNSPFNLLVLCKKCHENLHSLKNT